MRRVLLSSLLVLASGALAEPAASQKQAREKLRLTAIKADAESLVQYAASGDFSTVGLLIAAGVPANAVEPRRQVTALHNAAALGQSRIVDLLLDRGGDVNAQDWHGVTPLINAVQGGHAAVVERLLKAGARVDTRPSQGPTALLAAVQAQRAELVRQLLRAGASASQADAFGTTPLDAAQLTGREPMLKMLKDPS